MEEKFLKAAATSKLLSHVRIWGMEEWWSADWGLLMIRRKRRQRKRSRPSGRACAEWPCGNICVESTRSGIHVHTANTQYSLSINTWNPLMDVSKHTRIRLLIGVFPVPEPTLAARYFSRGLWTRSIQLSQLLWADVEQDPEQISSCKNGQASDTC